MSSDPKLPPALQYAADAEQKRTEAAELAVRAEHVTKELDELSAQYELDCDAALLPKIEKLEAEQIEIAKAIRRKHHAAANLDAQAAQAREADARRRNRARRKKCREASGERNAAAKRFEDAIEKLAEAGAAVEKANARMRLLWPAEIDPRGGAFYPGRLTAQVEHALLVAGRKYGFALPGGKYHFAEWRGFAQVIKTAHEYVAEVLSDDAPLMPVLPETFAPEPVAKVPAEPAPMEALSGAAWQALQDREAARAASRTIPDIDVFTGEPL